MRVLVTRPQAEATQTATRLRQLGHTPTIAALMRVEHHHLPDSDFASIDGLIVTSPRAVPAIATAPPELPVFTTGQRSAQTARDAGFAHVESGDGNWQALAQTIVQSERLRAGAQLLHVSGERVRGDLPTVLAGAGITYHRAIGYRMLDGDSLPPTACQWLEHGGAGAVLFFSPASSALWYRLADAYRDAMRPFAAVCISAACASALGDLVWSSHRIAAKPDEGSVLAALETLS